LAVKEEEIEEKEEVYFMKQQDENQEEFAEEADVGEMLVLRRILSGLITKK